MQRRIVESIHTIIEIYFCQGYDNCFCFQNKSLERTPNSKEPILEMPNSAETRIRHLVNNQKCSDEPSAVKQDGPMPYK